MTTQSIGPYPLSVDSDGWWACCPHCGCDADDRTGHDDTCASGCNDEEMA